MKNLKRRTICGILILMMLLTACNKTPVSNLEGQNTEVENTQQEETQEVVRQKSAILESATQMDEDGLIYYVPNERVESALQQEIAFFDGNLLVWGSGQNGFTVSLVSLQTGEVIKEKTFSGTDLPNAQVCGDKIAVIDWGTGKVSVLDKEFEVVDEYETNTTYCTIYLNNDATKIYCFTQNGVKVIDTESGSTSMLFDNALMLFTSGKCGDAVSVTYTDKETQMNESGIVDLTAGTAEKIPYEGAFNPVEYSDGVWLVRVAGEENQYYIGKSDRPKAFTPQGNYAMMTLIADPLRMMSTTYDGNGRATMTLYSLDGEFLSQTKLPEEVATVIYEPIWSEADGGYFFIVIDNTGKDILLFWDMSIPTVGESLTLESAYEENAPVDSIVSQDLLDRAATIGETYGVEILLGDQTEESYGNYNMAREMNESYIEEGLDAVEEALSKYPAGFMGQLLYGNQRELEIHLTGAFTVKELPEGEINGFTSYIGLAQEQEWKTVIVVDITMTGSIEQTLHHEIMHVIDNKMTFDANVREDAFYSEEAWNALNPADFTYVEDTFNLPESVYTDGYESYFIDIYSRTTAKEDRARIMEYAMIGADWAFSASPGRYAKLEYICQCIRDTFNTEGWPEQTIWEATLDRCKK